MAKKKTTKTPTQKVIERQKREEVEKNKQKQEESKEVDIDKLDWEPKKPKIQEIEVHPGTGELKMDQIDAWIEGTNIQIGNIIDQLNSLNVLCLENFKHITKYIIKENKGREKTIEAIHELLARPISADQLPMKKETKKTKKEESKSTKEIYIQKIIDGTGLPKEEINKMVKDKIEELKGLIAEEGALFIIGKELGVELRTEMDDIDYKIKDIDSHFKGNIAAIISRIDNIFTFIKKDGEDGRGQKVYITDGSGEIPLTLWNDQVNKIMNIKVGDQIIIYGAYGKDDTKYGLSLQLFKDAKIIKKS